MFKVGQKVVRKQGAKVTDNWRWWKQQGNGDVLTVESVYGSVFHIAGTHRVFQAEFFLLVVEDFDERDWL